MFAFGLKVPVPLVVHTPVVVLPVMLPVNDTLLCILQTGISAPNTTFADGVMLNTMASETAVHKFPLFPVLVKVSVTVPANTSAALGW